MSMPEAAGAQAKKKPPQGMGRRKTTAPEGAGCLGSKNEPEEEHRNGVSEVLSCKLHASS